VLKIWRGNSWRARRWGQKGVGRHFKVMNNSIGGRGGNEDGVVVRIVARANFETCLLR
jgi:hypothetical protein